MANQVAIRDWLKQQGYTDQDIGWQNGQVTLKGREFYKPESITGGRSYGSADALKRAIEMFGAQSKPPDEKTPPATAGPNVQTGGITSTGTTSQPSYTVFGGATPPAGTVPIRDYLVGRGYGNKGIGWQNDLVTLGENVAIKPTAVAEGRSYAPVGTIESALKASGFKTPEQARIDALTRRYEEMVNKPLEYNPETDPRYQAARKLQEAEAEKASLRAMQEMNARGMLNSTVTSDRLAQIQQQAAQNVYSMIPGLYQAAQQERQSELTNIAGLLGTLSGLGEQEFSRGVQEAGLTGYWGGVPTMAREVSDRNYTLQAVKNYLDMIGTFGEAPSEEYLPTELTWAAGKKTEAARQFDTQLAQRAQEFAKSLNLDWSRLTQDQQQFLKQQALRERQQAFGEEQAQLEVNRQISTNKAISDILTAPNKDEAYNTLNESIRNGEFADVDLPAVIKAIESRYGTSGTLTGDASLDAILKRSP